MAIANCSESIESYLYCRYYGYSDSCLKCNLRTQGFYWDNRLVPLVFAGETNYSVPKIAVEFVDVRYIPVSFAIHGSDPVITLTLNYPRRRTT